ncbi:MAG: xanthine dehydrogenase small subunit [Steroidobacteraceae bacterium]
MSGEHTIRFLMDGEVHTVEEFGPTTTVLQYLRDHRGRCGTKEGCAEGDCGACTVVLAELAGSEIEYRAINACIRFLPTLDGKALLTVESLKSASAGELHPVQRALVECHGSQCGFCTPGFVMSLYALYRIDHSPGEDVIRHALSGNLCRCTGYRPILAAARRMYEYPKDGDVEREGKLKELLLAIRVTREKRLTAAGWTYVAPTTVAELAQALAARPDATILAGGTDIGLRVTKQHAELPAIVYIGNVAELKSIVRTEQQLEIGAGMNLTDAFAALLAEYPDLWEISRRFASPPICNAGTLCGNVANGSPIGDSIPALICLDATVVVRSGAGSRNLALQDFYLDYMKTDLRPGEFVAAVRVARARKGQLIRCYKIAKRFDQDISAVCGAFAIELSAGRVRSARICFGGMAATPRRASACEQALVGADWSPAGIRKAVQALAEDFQPITDFRASQAYRTRVAGNLLQRFVSESSHAGGNTSVWSYAG